MRFARSLYLVFFIVRFILWFAMRKRLRLEFVLFVRVQFMFYFNLNSGRSSLLLFQIIGLWSRSRWCRVGIHFDWLCWGADCLDWFCNFHLCWWFLSWRHASLDNIQSWSFRCCLNSFNLVSQFFDYFVFLLISWY